MREVRADLVRVALHRRRTDRFVRVLRIGLRLEEIRFLRDVLGAERPSDELTNLRQRLLRHARRVRAHVRDETDRVFTRQLHAFVQLLRDHHRLFDGEPGRLLKLARDERRNGVLLPLSRRNGVDDPHRLTQVRKDRV